MIKKFYRQFSVNATLKSVAKFHHDTHNLKTLSPPPIFVQFHRVEPLEEGSIADFTLWLGPVPVRWVAVHSNVDFLSGFTDTQEKGPFTFWQHRHGYYLQENVASGIQSVEVYDEISAIPGKGLWKSLVSHIFLLGIPFLFWYRAWRTRRSVE